MSAQPDPADRLDDRGRPCLADSDPTIRTRCMQLRDAHMSLRGIAQVLAQDYPDVFERPPSPTSVAKWADQGVEEWERLFGQSGRDALDAAKVRPRKVRRIHRLMGQLAMAAEGYGDLDAVTKVVKAQATLEQLEARLVGTDAPRVVQLTAGDVPAVSPETAAHVEATVQPAALPRRRTS